MSSMSNGSRQLNKWILSWRPRRISLGLLGLVGFAFEAEQYEEAKQSNEVWIDVSESERENRKNWKKDTGSPVR